ncbi:hypothetical protein FEM48_Zijuj05G0189400 [Ziziphus jujuba var. spinosa]|uniref:DCD domain-containing protein n=1 Tax=Ziziphus jujuba var. spinosa TaxID=714518 RepID=A0A978VGK0_ZIZJJ|nr:hypothetical protein FEM48_Zijuj05G0189400 [Ziziphus jujuba var. spinosa]
MTQAENNSETDGTKETEPSAVAFNSPKETVMEVSGKETETPVEAFSKPIDTPIETLRKAPAEASKEAPPEASNKPLETHFETSGETAQVPTEMSNKSSKMPAETSSEPKETPAKALYKSESSGKKTLKPLKAKSKIGKKSLIAYNLKVKKNKGSLQDRGKKTEAPAEAINNPTETPLETSNKPTDAPPKALSKSESSGKKTVKAKSKVGEKSVDVNNQKAKKNRESLQDHDKKTYSPAEAIKNPIETSVETSSEPTELSPQGHGKKRRSRVRGSKSKKEINDNEESGVEVLRSRKENQSGNTTKKEHSRESHRVQKYQESIIESEKSQHKQKTKTSDGSEKNLNTQKNKGKHADIEKSQRSGKKEKLGGLIFMCSGKTKPDCFHYRIMGISIGKKDLVLGIKPGMKLFLYDFDLKLLYGVYRASSSGGVKLEPKAFGGAFPAQVRFNVEKDCLPLPESVFKKAIKENYNEKNKFKTELTIRQVRKLTALFRPAEVHSSALSICSVQGSRTHDERIRKEVRESLTHSHRDKHGRDPHVNDDARTYPVHVATTRRKESSRNLFMTEKEYRAYGLSGERSLTHPSHITTPPLDPYQRDYERKHLRRHQNLIYREAVPDQRETLHADPFYMDDKEYQVYSLGARHELPSAAPITATSTTNMDSFAKDPYYSYYHSGSSVAPLRREGAPSSYYTINGSGDTYLIESADPFRRRETDPVDRLYLKYDVDPLRGDRQIYQAAKPEPVPMPVSSRYSFPGPSFSHR